MAFPILPIAVGLGAVSGLVNSRKDAKAARKQARMSQERARILRGQVGEDNRLGRISLEERNLGLGGGLLAERRRDFERRAQERMDLANQGVESAKIGYDQTNRAIAGQNIGAGAGFLQALAMLWPQGAPPPGNTMGGNGLVSPRMIAPNDYMRLQY